MGIKMINKTELGSPVSHKSCTIHYLPSTIVCEPWHFWGGVLIFHRYYEIALANTFL